MKLNVPAAMSLAAVMLISLTTYAQKNRGSIEIVPARPYSPLKVANSAKLQSVLDRAVNQTIANSAGLKPDEIAATLIDLGDPSNVGWASIRGDERIYPASVVKMFYMAALERQLEDGKVTATPELLRGLRDMIVDSSNEATQYILDVLTDTSGGAELPTKEFTKWQYKRNRVNRFYSSMGFSNINVNQKTFCEDAYGIERQSRNFPTEAANRNKLNTNSTARLLAEIVTGRTNTPDRTKAMMDLLSRDWTKASDDPDSQAVGFTGKALIDMKLEGTKLWSKAGWVSKQRHDAAYIETPDGLKFVLVVFTENHSNDREVIPTIVKSVISGLRG